MVTWFECRTSLTRFIFDNYGDMQFLLMSRFSQDFLENMFSTIRSRNGHCATPQCAQVKSALKSIAYSSCITSSIPSLATNCNINDSDDEENIPLLPNDRLPEIVTQIPDIQETVVTPSSSNSANPVSETDELIAACN